jgi:hypothetical protein
MKKNNLKNFDLSNPIPLNLPPTKHGAASGGPWHTCNALIIKSK